MRDAFALDTGVINSWSLQFGGPFVFTDASGNYTLTDLLTISNFLAQTYTVQPVWDGFQFSPPGIPTSPISANVNFTLLSGFISGRVLDYNNNGVAGVTVSTGTGVSATTDANGNYRLAALPPPNATLTAAASRLQ